MEIPRDFDAVVAARDGTATARIYLYEGDLKSGFAADRLEKFFRDLGERTVRERLQARALPASLADPMRVERQNVAPPEKVSGAVLGGLIPYFVILFCLTGAMYPAIDLTAGEKERGTMETILCSPVSRLHLVLGKFFMVLTASLAAAMLSMLSMALTLAGGMKIVASTLENGAALPLVIRPQALLWVFVMIIPLAVLFSAALLAIALFAKSFKEAQSYLSPLAILGAAARDYFVSARWRGAECGVRAGSGSEHQSGEQGDRVRHFPLELSGADFSLVIARMPRWR